MIFELRKAVCKSIAGIGLILGLLLLLAACIWLNSPPAAVFEMSASTGEAPLTVEFDASGSSDSDGTIVSYEWDFGDGHDATGDTVEHIFEEAGTYTVTLTVCDDQGETASTSQNVTVEEGQLSLAARFTVSPSTGEAPLTVEFDASGSSDPDGTIVSYEWDFGDGQDATGDTVEHIFEEAGTYRVTLTVSDDQGLTASTSRDITVTAGGVPPPPPPPPD
jgi:PKD repeat protein